MISKTKIDKIGQKLKANQELTIEEYKMLLEWRNSFSASLDYYYERVQKKVDKENSVAFAKRLKRIASIKIKLKRFSSMRLSTIQDIGGMRVILKDKQTLEAAFTSIRNAQTKNVLKRLDNYHHTPKEDGYRGVHLVYQSNDTKMIEIQLRTYLEHIWATAVEVYGTLQTVSFKTGEGDNDWKDFFKLLSSYFAISEKCSPLNEHEKMSEKKLKSKLKKMISKLKVIERLNAATNSIEVIVNKRNQGRPGKYALLELDYEKGQTKIDIFTKGSVSEAIKEYTQKEFSFAENDKRNIVFVNIESIENIQASYPNYFLDTKKLLEILSKIVLDQI